MKQEKINKQVKKIIQFMLDNGELVSNGNILALDLEKGFLFFNSSKGWLYSGFSMLSEPNYLTGETKRESKLNNYTIGKTNKSNYILHKDKTIEDLKELYNQIMKVE
jgi:hypothetical protein